MSDIEDLDNLEDVEVSNNCLVDENEELQLQIEPKVGMVFNDMDELYVFYKNYAKAIGFPLRKQAARKNVAGIVRSVTFTCSRGGKPSNTSQNPLKPQASYKIGCSAYLTARLNLYGRWEITVVVLEHNHNLSPSKSRFFRCNRRISAHVRHQINLNDQAGIRMNKNFDSLVHEAGGHENLSCGEKDYCEVVNFREGEGMMEYKIQETIWLEDGRKIPKYFIVSFHVENGEVDCSCKLFVFKGILCRHSITILVRHDVNLLPDKYILRRWRKDVGRAHSKMKVKFNCWENTPEQLRYRELTIAFSEVADRAAKCNHEYEDVKSWIDNKLHKLELSDMNLRPKEAAKDKETVEVENDDEEDGRAHILDPRSQTRKGRPRKNTLKPASRRSKKKNDVCGKVTTDIATQVGVGTSTQESVVSNPYMLQPWGVHWPTQQFTKEHSLVPPMYGLQHFQTMGVSPMYGMQYLPPQDGTLSSYRLQKSDVDHIN